MNNFNSILEHYRGHNPDILSKPANEWAIDPYAWEGVFTLTPIEQWLWGDIRDANAVMYPQYPVGRFFVDFGNPVAKLAIECDGAAFHQDKAKDEARDAEIRALGWNIYHLTGSECRTEYNEETHELGTARIYVEALCIMHKTKRKGSFILPKFRTPEWAEHLGQLSEKVE